jgi:hypothetical protein
VLTADEWIFLGILTFIIYGIGGWPRVAARLFGENSPTRESSAVGE